MRFVAPPSARYPTEMKPGSFWGAVPLGVALLSCATQPAITAQNYETGLFTVCGSQQATKSELSQRALKACAVAPKVLRCTADTKYPSVGMEGEMTVSGNCCDYQCPPGSSLSP
jgi:hypothetical protein